MKDKNWSYLAGIFDGEGCICISKQTVGRTLYKMNVILSNTDLRLMKWLVEHFGGQYYTQSRNGLRKKIEFRWSPKGKKNRELFFLGIAPYLILKRDQALLALEFERLTDDNPSLREEMYLKMKALKTGESVEINTPNTSPEVKIESELS